MFVLRQYGASRYFSESWNKQVEEVHNHHRGKKVLNYLYSNLKSYTYMFESIWGYYRGFEDI